MTSGQAPKVAPIKLKLSLGPRPKSNPPPTPTPGPSTPTPTPTIKLHTKKGKEKSQPPPDDSRLAIASKTVETGEPSRPKKNGKSKETPVDAVSVTNGDLQDDISINADHHAGPSKITLPAPSPDVQPQNPTKEVKVEPPAEAHSQISVPTTPVSTPKPKLARGSATKKSTPRTSTKGTRGSARNQKAGIRGRPSAIPSRLLSESAVSTPFKTSSIPHSDQHQGQNDFETPTADNSLDNSEATSPDPLAGPFTPSAYNDSPSVSMGTPLGEGYDDTPQSRGHRTGGRWMRIKRPLKELANRVLVEMRRKDDYALFEEPVDLDAFPDYLDVIGGEDKMMDMGTMQKKLDNGEYSSIEEVERDLNLLVDAAQKFNPPGSIPYNAAARVLLVGMKHIERAKPLVLTPSPSPSRDSATPFDGAGRGYSVYSGREGTAAIEEANSRRVEEIAPTSYIPEQMLDFPPNSLQALAVGWNLNGGKRVHAKRVVRSREKFNGKWRHWEIDGTRDIAEMEDIISLLDNWKIPDQGKVIDWKGLRRHRNEQGWWYESDSTLSGPTTVPGQPPIPFMPHAPRRDKIVEKERDVNEYGVQPGIDAEIKFLRKRTGSFAESEDEILSEHLRPIRPRPRNKAKLQSSAKAHFNNIYENSHPLGRDSNDWIREMINGGDVKGEAYLNSIQRFVQGAMAGASHSETTSSTSDEAHGDFKVEEHKNDTAEEVYPLDQYVLDNYHDGLLYEKSTPRKIILDILTDVSKPTEERSDYVKGLLENSYAKIALDELTSPSNPMDIKPLLRLENDFLHQGIGSTAGRNGITEGLEWVGKEIQRLNEKLKVKVKLEQSDGNLNADLVGLKRKREDGMSVGMSLDSVMESKKAKLDLDSEPVSNASSPLSAAPDSPKMESSAMYNSVNAQSETGKELPKSTTSEIAKPSVSVSVEDELRSLRLELVALSKFYPLPALKKMRAHEAARLLPANVRGLMTVPEDLERLKRDAERLRGVSNVQMTSNGFGNKPKVGK
ncbi:uncharacterized protein I303_101194 [Kwoniella dejecticola CBS 10117]|uniref:Bromo domain-containing protein n=1 Tax=Kwoniella dejecticola CBS 10117 TaxID=1296121 RepID=A0A1A6AH84_9TREE|nr:uncharacterized protein I303_01200 [Kwoniella dejecticola CBS 10117]OBR89373.1 hypothetical protein I303_01200 [Kwoniella dejecticola CBS 10117]